MISNFLEILILSIVQGISEFLPISSSAHLFLVSEIYKFNSQSLLVDVGLHLGSLLAIIFYFRNELKEIVNNKNLFFLMVLGSLPVIILGAIIYKTGLINYFRNIEVIAWTTLIFGILLFIADRFSIKNKIDTNLSLKNILIIGIFQILAVIPGVSRSGIIITASRFLNFDRVDSSRISFYLSIPALAGASILSLKDVMIDVITLIALKMLLLISFIDLLQLINF